MQFILFCWDVLLATQEPLKLKKSIFQNGDPKMAISIGIYSIEGPDVDVGFMGGGSQYIYIYIHTHPLSLRQTISPKCTPCSYHGCSDSHFADLETEVIWKSQSQARERDLLPCRHSPWPLQIARPASRHQTAGRQYRTSAKDPRKVSHSE